MSTFDATNHGSSNATPQATPTFVFTNNKGGVGKSTSATNVAYGLVQTLRFGGVTQPRVLLVDTDGQAHATLLTTGRNDFGEKDSLHAVLMAGRKTLCPRFSSVWCLAIGMRVCTFCLVLHGLTKLRTYSSPPMVPPTV
jgi:hypothetical protein